FFFSSRRRHTRFSRDWSSDVCSSDLPDRHGDHARVPGLQFRVERFRLMCHDEYLLYSAGEAGDQGLVSWSPALRFCGSALHHGLVNVAVIHLDSDAFAAELTCDFLGHGDGAVTAAPAGNVNAGEHGLDL